MSACYFGQLGGPEDQQQADTDAAGMSDGSSGAMDPTAGGADTDGADTSTTGSTPDPTGDGSTGQPADPGTPGDGIPCDIEEILATNCRACHGATPAGGAPNSLLTIDDLLADALTAPGSSVAEASADRIQGIGGAVMPPAPAAPLSQADIDTWTAWVDAGTPTGDCADPPIDPFDVDPVCTTNTYWTQGLFSESDRMNPGRECIACHENPGAFGGNEGGPGFAFAGTLFATAHEPDDCNGVNGGAQVVITDANGATVTMSVNSAGNFYAEPGSVPGTFTAPLTAKVVANGQERVMATALESGDCNHCHTQDGTEMAPGRIILP
jgi:mono/diheme cytochrome c family protein